jgi:hypothetical protein
MTKAIGLSSFFGLLLTLAVVYLLQPLNGGAIALVALLCIGAAAAIGALLGWLFKKKT